MPDSWFPGFRLKSSGLIERLVLDLPSRL